MYLKSFGNYLSFSLSLLSLSLSHAHTHTPLSPFPTPSILSLSSTQDFGKEILADEKPELKQEKILAALEKASGAAYGTGR